MEATFACGKGGLLYPTKNGPKGVEPVPWFSEKMNRYGFNWLQTKEGIDWIQTKEGSDWLKSDDGQYWLKTESV